MVYFIKHPPTGGPSLSVIATISVGVVTEKKTTECFRDESRYAYRDPCLDFGLPHVQPKRPACAVTVLALKGKATAAELAVTVLGIAPGLSLEEVGKLIAGRHLTATLTQVEAIAKKAAVLNANTLFFFVEGRNGIGVVFVSRERDDAKERLSVCFDRALDRPRFSPDDRLFICNGHSGRF